VGVGVPLIAGLPAAALITNDVYIHGTLGFNTAWISTGTPGWKYLTAGNAGIISFDPAAATPGIGFYIGPAGAAGAAASMPNAAYMSATSFVATGSITSGTAVIAGTHIYCGGTLLINPANSWEWYFARDGSGNHIHNHRANWYDMWNGADGKRSWASPSGDCMTLDGSGNFVARGNVQGAWVYSTGQVRADTSSVAYGQIISYGQRVSAEGSGEPSVFMHRPGAYAAGMLLNGSNQLLFANMGGGGNWQATLGYFDTSGNFWATAALTGNWIHSTGSMQIDGDATVNGRITANYIRATDSIMCDSGNFFIGNNQAYRLQRESWSGSWVFYDNNTWNFQVNSNGDAQTRMTHYAQDHFCRNALRTGNDWNFYLGPGGGGRLLQFAGNWYQQWNSSNGEYAWYANGGWMFGQRTSDWLCWNGTGPVGGYGAYQNFSDARGKTDITHTEVGLPEVMRMKPARFTRKWKPELITGRTFPDGRPQPDFIPRSEIGFIAQELQEALPEAVVEVADFVDGEARLMMTLDPIVAALVNAVKTLNGRLVKLEGRH
jgi:hypothetical protein